MLLRENDCFAAVCFLAEKEVYMKEHPETMEQEQAYAAVTIHAVRGCIEKELSVLKQRRGTILEERKYFIDYFYELKDDEKRDLLANEFLDTKSYEYTLNTLARLGKQLREPYFARFDFVEDGQEDEDTAYYLSIHTLRDPETGRILTYDWRAPISSLYYEMEPGPAYFTAPMGKVAGTLLKKRRYQFKDGVLKRFSDISMPSDDELLAEVLGANADTHMKTIVQTLQREQHMIVRDYVEGISVIQGCAGSGKSSIALHKAAYVLYSFRERLRDQQMAILSPNTIFAEYISSVLPDLGEENVNQLLPEAVVEDCLQQDFEYHFLDRMATQEYILTCGDEAERSRLRKVSAAKSGMPFRNTVNAYIQYLSACIFDPADLYLDDDFTVCVERGTLYNYFYDTFQDFPLLKRTAQITKAICGTYKIKSPEKREFIQQALSEMMRSVSVPVLYRMMYEDPVFLGTQAENIKSLAPGSADLWEDACAVALINDVLSGPESDSSMFYLIADEAQDFSPVFLELLYHRYRGCNMLFVGDANQLVYATSGNFVEDIQQVIPKRPFRKYELNTNYRSTKEIMEFACRKTGRSADSVICVRSGDAPRVVSVLREIQSVSEEEHNHLMGNAVADYIAEMKARGYGQFAVLCKTAAEAKAASAQICLSAEIASDAALHVIPVYLAKGLEFDCVAVWNGSDIHYGGPGDRELFFTACTRAMHQLLVVY